MTSCLPGWPTLRVSTPVSSRHQDEKEGNGAQSTFVIFLLIIRLFFMSLLDLHFY